MRWVGDEISCFIFAECLHLLIHCFDPWWILGCFGENFRFSNCYHLHHKGIVVCHIVVVAELANWILLTARVTEFLICRCECFLNSGWPKKRHIKATEHTIEWEWVDSLSSNWSSSYSGILALPLSIFVLGRDVLWSLGVSCGPLILVVIGLSSNICLSWSPSSMLSRSFINVSEGFSSGSYHGVDSSKTTSLLTRTFRVEGL